jgi:hypothetical protein
MREGEGDEINLRVGEHVVEVGKELHLGELGFDLIAPLLDEVADAVEVEAGGGVNQPDVLAADAQADDDCFLVHILFP